MNNDRLDLSPYLPDDDELYDCDPVELCNRILSALGAEFNEDGYIVSFGEPVDKPIQWEEVNEGGSQ